MQKKKNEKKKLKKLKDEEMVGVKSSGDEHRPPNPPGYYEGDD